MCRGERRAGKPGVYDVGIVVERSDDVLRKPHVLEGLVSRFVAEDEPRVVTVSEADLLHRTGGSHRLEQGIRIVAGGLVPGTPGGDRLRHRGAPRKNRSAAASCAQLRSVFSVPRVGALR